MVRWCAKEGTVVAGGNGAGDDISQLHHPISVTVDRMGTVYVVEYDNNRVTRWFKGAK